MSEPDYTEIRVKEIRGKICELMSEMLDNPDENEIYPTSRFMWKMENYCIELQMRCPAARVYTNNEKLITRLKEVMETNSELVKKVLDLGGGVTREGGDGTPEDQNSAS